MFEILVWLPELTWEIGAAETETKVEEARTRGRAKFLMNMLTVESWFLGLGSLEEERVWIANFKGRCWKRWLGRPATKKSKRRRLEVNVELREVEFPFLRFLLYQSRQGSRRLTWHVLSSFCGHLLSSLLQKQVGMRKSGWVVEVTQKLAAPLIFMELRTPRQRKRSNSKDIVKLHLFERRADFSERCAFHRAGFLH